MSPVGKPPAPKRQTPLGQPPGKPDARKRDTVALSTYFTSSEAAAIRRAAAERNLSVSEFMRGETLHDLHYGTGDFVEQVHQLARDPRNHPILESRFRVWVEGLTGVAMLPPLPGPLVPVHMVVAAPALPPAPMALSAPSPVPVLPAPATGTAIVSAPAAAPQPEVCEPMWWELEPAQPTFADAVISVLAGVYRWLLRATTRAGDRMGSPSLYHKLIGRTPLQFMVAIVFAIGAIVRSVGPAPLGYYLLGATGASAETVLKHLPGDEERRQRIGYVVMAVPANAERINACLDQKYVSRHDFWCKFRMKAGR